MTGLNDYELSEEDKEVLATKLFDGGQSGSPTSGDGYWKEAREFQLSELFGQPTRGTRLTKGKRVSGDVPLVTAGFNNEGVAEYIGNLEQQTFHGGLTIDMFGNCFYRDYDFKADDNILVFDKTDISEETKLYVATNIRKSLNGLFDYGRQYRQKTYNETTVSLPIQTTSEKEPVIDEEKRYHPEGYVPDWEYMEKYIRALEKVVVKDVVEWKDEMIEKTKMVVEE